MNEFEKRNQEIKQREMLINLKSKQLELLKLFKEEEEQFSLIYEKLESDIPSNNPLRLKLKTYCYVIVELHKKTLEAYSSQLIKAYDNALNQDDINSKQKRATKGRPSKYPNALKYMIVLKYQNNASIKDIVNYVNALPSNYNITDKQVRRILENQGVYKRKVRSSNEK